MSQKSEAKYAAEAFELFCLFDRIGRSFYGLLLLEIGWLLTLLLAAKLTGEEGGSPILAVPVITGFRRPYISFEEVRITALAVVGGILIFAGWAFYSRLHHYLFAPIGLVFRHVLKWLLIAVVFLIGTLSIPLLLVTWPLERWLLRRTMREEKRKWIEDYKQSHPDADADTAYVQMSDELKKKYGDKILEKRALKKVPVKKDTVIDTTMTVLVPWLRTLYSSGRIGIAPLATYTYAEDFQAAKIQLQVFAVAIAKLHAVLRDLEAIKHIRFYILPSHFKVTSNRQAVFVSRLFGCDVLLWGSYLDPAGETVWLNIHKTSTANAEKEDPDEFGFEFQHGIFPYQVEVDTPSVTISQKDQREAYIVLCTALIQVLQRRVARRSKEGKFKYLDRLYLGSGKAISNVLLHLVLDTLQFLPDKPISGEVLPSAAAHLAEIAGKWVGKQLSKDYGRDEEDLWGKATPRKFARQLYEIAEKCSRLMPEHSEHFYRLGAIACILGDKEKALLQFKQAEEADARSTRVHHISAGVVAERESEDAERSEDQELSLARFAAHAACAINTGDDSTIKGIREGMEKSSFVALCHALYHAAPNERPLPIPILVVEEMLKSATLSATAVPATTFGFARKALANLLRSPCQLIKAGSLVFTKAKPKYLRLFRTWKTRIL